jgi:hypothetical protein
MPLRLPPFLLLTFLFVTLAFSSTFSHLKYSTEETEHLYGKPLYSFEDHKYGFDRENIYIKNESVIMLCYMDEKVFMVVYWNSGLSFEGASEILKQNGMGWTEQDPAAYQDQLIRKHNKDSDFRVTPYLSKLKVWKSADGDYAFYDSFKRELKIQGSELGVKKMETPNEEFYLKLREAKKMDTEETPTKDTSVQSTTSTTPENSSNEPAK